MYGPAVAELIRNPKFAGDLPDASASHEETNPVCGDVIRYEVRVKAGRIDAIRWKAQGCPPALAAAELLASRVMEKETSVALELTPEELLQELPGLPATSRHAVELALDALRGVLRCQAPTLPQNHINY